MITLRTLLTVLVDLFDDLLQRGRLHLEPHHGEDVADVVRRDGALLVGKAVEASLQHVDLVAVQAHVVLKISKSTFDIQQSETSASYHFLFS